MEKFSLTPNPSWVSPINYQLEKSEEYHYLYVGREHLESPDESQLHVTQCVYIRNEKDLKNYQKLDISFNPSFQELSFHELKINRDREEISLEKELNYAEVLRRENNLEAQILDGRLSVCILIRDLRIGDIFTYSYSKKGINPLWEKFRFIDRDLEWSVPVKKQFIRILWGLKDEYCIKYFANTKEISPEIKKKNEFTELTWILNDLKEKRIPEQSPGWLNLYHSFQFSNQLSWKDVINWGLKLYNFDHVILNADLVKTLESLKAKSTKETIRNILVFVQENIRYLSLAIKDGTHKPRDPNEVFNSRLGDCKDKTSLFIYMVNYYKFEEVTIAPFLVNTFAHINIKENLPSPFSFDHVIAYVKINEKEYYFDPTYASQKYNFDQIPQPYYFDYGLLLHESEQDIKKVKHTIPTAVEIKVTYDLSDGPGKDVKFNIVEKISHFKAENSRDHYESIGEEEFKNNIKAFYKKYFNEISLVDFKVNDDKDNNIFETLEQYLIKDFWEESNDHFTASIYPFELYSKFTKPRLIERDSIPLDITKDPDGFSYQITIVSDRVWSYESSNSNSKNKHWIYESTKNEIEEEKKIVLTSSFKALENMLPEEKVKEYYDFIELFETDLALDFTSAKEKGKFKRKLNKRNIFWITFIIFMIFRVLYRIFRQ